KDKNANNFKKGGKTSATIGPPRSRAIDPREEMGNEASTPIPYNVQVEWRKLVSGSPAVPAGREGQVAASWENKLYIFGGGSSGGTQRADVWTFDLGIPQRC